MIVIKSASRIRRPRISESIDFLGIPYGPRKSPLRHCASDSSTSTLRPSSRPMPSLIFPSLAFPRGPVCHGSLGQPSSIKCDFWLTLMIPREWLQSWRGRKLQMQPIVAPDSWTLRLACGQ